MNRLERALLDTTNESLDTYLEVSKNREIRADIEEIRMKAVLSTLAGQIMEKLRMILDEV